MKKIEMSVSMAGSNFSHQPGDVVEVSDEIFKAWCSVGIGKPAKTERETAVLSKKEKAVIE